MYVYFTLLYSAFIKQPDEYTGCVQSKYWRHICLLSGYCAQVCWGWDWRKKPGMAEVERMQHVDFNIDFIPTSVI